MIAESMYQELILEHYKHPQGRGLREPYDAEVHHVNPTCGDEITLRVKVESGKVADVSYEGQGCSISQAAASVLHELAAGSTVVDSLAVVDEFTRLMQGRGTVQADEEVLGDAVAFAGVAKFPARVKCALLAWMAYKDAVVRSS
ncbi:SUF system NifU family Fe-S cluster assembly protein [Acrocarpospora macrocephala]|uniref:Iron-sulfur cluster assembly scaffold protein NifU n=1 Tax=Acrocarpospora macrocephala TaxID=150177 RepID=A0A5M3WVG6_9ACTN|nr:SUF system NifU family Fe-S cluster assembly protein [Acrocarpospora macrocephala]GES11301.1 iron-sulfur cluster assembly scaffold protein NifU [Acrocarpospora macrocephala]